MTVTVYRSTDASAPPLEGVVGGAFSGGHWTTGSLLELLNQILVLGYGSQPAAGWTLSFTGTSQGDFKQGAGCGYYLDVLDDASLTAGAKEARLIGYEVMTAVGTGTNLFPTAAQQSTGLKFRKSDTADTTQRSWICFADASTFYLYSFPTNVYAAGCGFGNYHSFVSGDTTNCMIMGRITSASTDAATNETIDLMAVSPTLIAGHYIARNYGLLPGSTQNSILQNPFVSGVSTEAIGGSSLPAVSLTNPADNTVQVVPCYILETTAPSPVLRGTLRGFWQPARSVGLIPRSMSFNGIGTLSGRQFLTLPAQTGNVGMIYMESSNSWDA